MFQNNHRSNIKRIGSLFFVIFLQINISIYAQDDDTGDTKTPETAKTSENSRKFISGNYLIKPGDLLEIRVFNRPQMSRKDIRVDDIGTIKMPFLDEEVYAKCRTARQLSKELVRRYDEYLQDPQVEVIVTENEIHSIAILGAVKTPSRLQLEGRQNINLLDMLALVGGPAENAGNTVQIIHNDSDSVCTDDSKAPIESDQKLSTSFYKLKDTLAGNANPVLRAGDIVVLQEADQAFIVGNVLRPSALLLQEPVTVTQALAMVGGTLSDTNSDRLKIIRQIPGSTRTIEIPVDLEAIEKQKTEDIYLEPNDILSVPISGKKRLFKTFLGSIIPSIANLPVQVIR